MLDFGWCCANDDTNGLWFNDRWAAVKFTSIWQQITQRYAANPLVAGMDIKNEPRHATVGGALRNRTACSPWTGPTWATRP